MRIREEPAYTILKNLPNKLDVQEITEDKILDTGAATGCGLQMEKHRYPETMDIIEAKEEKIQNINTSQLQNAKNALSQAQERELSEASSVIADIDLDEPPPTEILI